MNLRTVKRLCMLLAIASVVLLIGSQILKIPPLLYLGVLTTIGHVWVNLTHWRCPHCGGSLIGSDENRCRHCGHTIDLDA